MKLIKFMEIVISFSKNFIKFGENEFLGDEIGWHPHLVNKIIK